MKGDRPRTPRERAASLGWAIHPRIAGDEPDPGRGELLAEVVELLAELDTRSLETWRAALRSRGGR